MKRKIALAAAVLVLAALVHAPAAAAGSAESFFQEWPRTDPSRMSYSAWKTCRNLDRGFTLGRLLSKTRGTLTQNSLEEGRLAAFRGSEEKNHEK